MPPKSELRRRFVDFNLKQDGMFEEFLSEYTDLIPKTATTPLGFASARGKDQLVLDLLNMGWGKNERDIYGETPLMKAVICGHMPVVKTLLYKDVDVNIVYQYPEDIVEDPDDELEGEVYQSVAQRGDTALSLAAYRGRDDMVVLLLDKGADLHCGLFDDDDGDKRVTPLIHAAANGHFPVVKTLLGRGAKVNAADWSDTTALHGAATQGSNDVVVALLSAGAGKDACNILGETPLITAAREGHLPVMETLLAAGCDPTIREKEEGYAAIHYVAQRNKVEHVNLLLQWGADETALDKDGKTPADLIDESKPQAEAVRRLLARAPADRAWRRRGWLVMLRSRTLKSGGSGGDAGGRSVKQRSGSGGGREGFDLFAAVAQLGVGEEGVFRNVIGFL